LYEPETVKLENPAYNRTSVFGQTPVNPQ